MGEVIDDSEHNGVKHSLMNETAIRWQRYQDTRGENEEQDGDEE